MTLADFGTVAAAGRRRGKPSSPGGTLMRDRAARGDLDHVRNPPWRIA
jgi:hypothetical protein